MISAGLVKAARALLGWSQETLAARAGLPLAAVARVEEAGGEDVGGEAAGEAQILAGVLQAAGVEFLGKDGDGVGVRMSVAKPEPIDTAELNASNDE